MTLDLFLDVLHSHLAALQSSWPEPHGPLTGPAIHFDRAETEKLIAELTTLKRRLATPAAPLPDGGFAAARSPERR